MTDSMVSVYVSVHLIRIRMKFRHGLLHTIYIANDKHNKQETRERERENTALIEIFFMCID